MLGTTPALVVLFALSYGLWAVSSTTHNVSKFVKARNNYSRKHGGRKPFRREGTSKIGRVVRFGEYKWVVAVYHSQYEYPKCAGIILTDLSVMTSCTCVTEEEYRSYAFPDTTKSLMVIAGNPDADNPFHESRTVLKIKIHPYCDREWVGTRADLAILEVNKSFQTDFYKHVAIVPHYGDLGDREAMKNALETFMNTEVFCEIVTFGYYDYKENPDKLVHRKYHFLNNHTMRSLQVIFVQPSDFCNATCPVPDRCVFDFFGREAACIAGIDEEVGPCGVLPGSPVFCEGNFWGIYTGQRNCSVPGAAAVPTVVSFTKFFEGLDYEETNLHSSSAQSSTTNFQLVLLGFILILS